MLLKKLKIKNIRSYKNAEIEFPEGSSLLMGDIGSGKTSILLAIEFALFGLQPSQKGSSLLRNDEDEASVRLEFEVDGEEIVIERVLTRGSKSISQGVASILIGRERFEGGVTEIKNKVLSLLSYPQEFAKKINDLYKFTVYTPQEEMKQIILEPNEVRLNTLRHVFGIDKYKRISENIDNLAIKMRQEIRIKEVQLEDTKQLEKEIQEKQIGLVSQQKKIKEIDMEIERMAAKKTEKQNEIKELEGKISERNNLEKEKAKSEIMLSNKKEILRGYEKETEKLKEQIREGKKVSFREDDVERTRTRISSQEQFLKQYNDEYIVIISRMQNQEARKKEIIGLKNKLAGMRKCPTCLQEVNENYKKNILAMANEELNAATEQNAIDQKKKIELEEKMNSIKKQVEAYKNSISEFMILKVKLEGVTEKEKKAEEMEKQKIFINKDILIMQEQVKNLNKFIAEFEKYTKIFEERGRELQAIIAKENSLFINKAEVKKEIQFLEQQIMALQEKIKRLEELSKRINYLKEAESWLSNRFLQFILYTEKSVMIKLREEFSGLLANWFSVLVSDELTIKLDETFTPIVQQNDYEIDYAFLSGGERTAVALAYRLALNQIINSLLSKIKTHDIVILDEPTDGFSESQLDKMRDVLHQLKVRQLIIVSHESKIEGFVDNIIRFKKTEGISEIEK